MNQRHAFLKALKENEDDISMRLVYSDWLDEQGEYEEADRQRKWPAAKAWLVRFCRDYNPPEDEVTDVWRITYNLLIDLGWQGMEREDEWGIHLSCNNNMNMCDALRANAREFWKNWSIVTGMPLAPDVVQKSRFACGC